ncbi:hypothetical protein B0H11DRAFT_1936004 [Mycena galericulata]|nr:hypothetical protein B0H11DRAFT_1936004 [Mycena galericulata]
MGRVVDLLSMAPVVIPANIYLPSRIGPFVLGFMWSYCLYGMLIVQICKDSCSITPTNADDMHGEDMYFETFPKDRFGFKVLVWSMFTLETVFTIFMTIAAWNAYGPGWGDLETLLFVDWSFEPLPALNSILAAMAQSFYVWRIWTLSSRKIWLPIAIIGSVMLTQVVAAFYYFDIRVTLEGRGVERLYVHSAEVTTWLAASALCDLLITGSLVFILYRRKRSSQIQETVGLINKLIRFSVETGCVTSIGALMELALWVACPHWNWYYILYSNMLMATLNCRATMFRADSSATVIIQSSLWYAAPGENSQAQSFEVSVQASPTTDVHFPAKSFLSV